MIKQTTQHSIAMITIILTTVFWGFGFVMSDIMLAGGMSSAFINMSRFCIATILLAIIFHKKLKIDKSMIIIGAICGLILFFAFELQLSALKYTTAAQNGFFTASYVVFVPLMVWVARRKAPTTITWIGIAVAVAGFVILNLFDQDSSDLAIVKDQQWLGNMMTIACAVLFALQITISDWALDKHKLHAVSFTFTQVSFAAIFFALYFVIFNLSSTDWGAIDWASTWLPLTFVALLCTAFAYPSQINAQLVLSPSTVSLIMAMEAVVGAFGSVLAGTDTLSWNLIVGGILVTLAIIIVEYLPAKLNAIKQAKVPVAEQQ